jgi:hypothetical protein
MVDDLKRGYIGVVGVCIRLNRVVYTVIDLGCFIQKSLGKNAGFFVKGDLIEFFIDGRGAKTIADGGGVDIKISAIIVLRHCGLEIVLKLRFRSGPMTGDVQSLFSLLNTRCAPNKGQSFQSRRG